MEVQWLIEDTGIFDNTNLIISEISNQNFKYKTINSHLIDIDKYNEFEENDCIVFYGSILLAKEIQRKKNWIPGVICNFNNFKCSIYYSHFGKYLLNSYYIMLPLMEFFRRKEEIYKLLGRNNSIFLRPDSGVKVFTGGTFLFDELNSELNFMKEYIGSCLEDILVVISSPKIIEKEWRVFVADNKPLTSSLYKENNELTEREGCDNEAWKLAKIIAEEKWQPDKTYFMDICKSENEYYLLEINSFSSSGMCQQPPPKGGGL